MILLIIHPIFSFNKTCFGQLSEDRKWNQFQLTDQHSENFQSCSHFIAFQPQDFTQYYNKVCHIFAQFFLNIRKLKICKSQPVPGSFKFCLGQFNHFDAGQNGFSSTSGSENQSSGFSFIALFLLSHFITVQNNCVVHRPHGSTVC